MISALKSLTAHRCVTQMGSLPQSVRHWWGQHKYICQRSTSSVGRNKPVGVLEREYQTMPYLPLN